MNLDNEIDLIEQEICCFNDNLENSEETPCFISLHIGAGYHSQAKTGAYRSLCEKICSEVIELLKQGCKARTAAATAVALLENSPLTNAGIGSNLTLEEKVECDASIMDSMGFGSVGGLSNIKNPIMVSLSLLEAQVKGTLSLGRIVPCMLVGEGAKKWALDNNLEEVDDDFLKTEAIIKTHRHYKQKLDNLEMEENGKEEKQRLDTVGAVAMDKNGRIASAVSSGGILLKHPGRVGHASMFGCGCWVAEDDQEESDEDTHSIGICTTGCGEYIIKTLFAKECADHILRNTDKIDYDLNRFFRKNFFNAPLLKNYSDKLIGALIFKLHNWKDDFGNRKKTLELIVAHTTPSMCFGYMSSEMHSPTSIMSRMNSTKQDDNESVQISTYHIGFSNVNNQKQNNQDQSTDTPLSESCDRKNKKSKI